MSSAVIKIKSLLSKSWDICSIKSPSVSEQGSSKPIISLCLLGFDQGERVIIEPGGSLEVRLVSMTVFYFHRLVESIFFLRYEPIYHLC